MDGIILSLCDRTGVMVQPWLEAGYECWIVDTRHEPGEHRDGNLVKVGGDIRGWIPPRTAYEACFAFPPCTDLANSGARWFSEKGVGALAGALELVDRCRIICEWTDAPWMLENPVGQLSTYWRKPDFTFDPCDYAGLSDESEAYTKKTCLWTGNGFVMPEHDALEPVLGSKMHLAPDSKGRADRRSVTPLGFARAVFQANRR
jgi:hypothetical protein